MVMRKENQQDSPINVPLAGRSAQQEAGTVQKIEKTLVPKLRFPEFQGVESWLPISLKEASTPVAERVGERKLTPVSISAGIGFVPQAEKFGRDISGNQYQLYTLVRDGDFVYNKGNSLKFPEGCVYLLQGWGQVAAPNVFICFRLKEGYSNGFFQNCFESNAHGKQLKKHITSGARSNGLLNISKDAFFGVVIPTPKSAEQQKIADCLSSLDELITAQARKVAALKTHKKGLMQQLFPREGETQPRLRLPEFRGVGEWTAGPISQFAEINPRREIRQDEVKVSFVPMNAVSENGFLAVQQTREYGAVKKGFTAFRDNDVILAKITPCFENGKAALVRALKNGVGFGSTEFHVIRAQKSCLPEFIFAQLYSDQFRTLGKTSMTGTGGHQRVPAFFIEDYVISVPGSPEQQRIADCLTSLDDLITATTQELETLKTHKKGLMQQLFPSAEVLEA